MADAITQSVINKLLAVDIKQRMAWITSSYAVAHNQLLYADLRTYGDAYSVDNGINDYLDRVDQIVRALGIDPATVRPEFTARMQIVDEVEKPNPFMHPRFVNIDMDDPNFYDWGRNCHIMNLTEQQAIQVLENFGVQYTAENLTYFLEGFRNAEI